MCEKTSWIVKREGDGYRISPDPKIHHGTLASYFVSDEFLEEIEKYKQVLDGAPRENKFELKPCPLCGGEIKQTGYVSALCFNCHMKFSKPGCSVSGIFIQGLNNRPGSEEPVENKPVPVWTREQVAELWARQSNGQFHPYTCGNRSNHPILQLNGSSDMGLLVPTIYGWICPMCDYKQGWSHETGDMPKNYT